MDMPYIYLLYVLGTIYMYLLTLVPFDDPRDDAG